MPNHVSQVVVFSGPKESIDKIKALLSDNEKERGSLDFNKLIPMPESMKITSGSATDDAITIIKSKAPTLLQYYINQGYSYHGGVLRDSRGRTGNYLVRDLVSKLKEVADNPDAITEAMVLNQTLSEVIAVAVKAKVESFVHGSTAIDNINRYGFKDWLGWSIANWGTKWNGYDGRIDQEEDDFLKISFSTAWSPPMPVYTKLAETFPEVSFTVKAIDEGWNFACILTAEEGDITEIDVECSRDNQDFVDLHVEVYGCEPHADEDDEDPEALEGPQVTAALEAPQVIAALEGPKLLH